MIVYRSAGAASLNAGSGNMTPGLPAGHALNDILVLAVWAADNIVCSVTGYTNKITTNTGTLGRLEVWWKRDGGSESGPTVTHTAGAGAIGQLFAFSGCVQTGDPFSTTSSQANTGTLTVTAASITPFLNEMVLFVGAVANNSGTSGSAQGVSGYASTALASAKWTEQSDQKNENGPNDVNGVLATALSPNNVTGNVTATEGWSYTAAATNNVGALLSLKPERPSFPVNKLRPAIFKPGFTSWR